MELSGLRTEVRERLNELTADFYTDAEVDRALNEGVRRFCAEEMWPFLLTEWTDGQLTADNAELDLPNNVSLTRVFNVAIDGDSLDRPRMLERVDAQEGFKLKHQYDGRTGIPRWYYIARSNLVLTGDEEPPIIYTAKMIPVPDATFTVDAQYMMVPIDLAAATDEPPIPLEYHEAVAAWATGKLLLKELAISQKASEQFGLYQKVLEQAKKDLRAFNLDETVAWGRQHPLRGYWADEFDPRFRIPPNVGI